MLISPCEERKVTSVEGDKPKISDLAIAHVTNFDCVKAFEIKMNDLRTWKSEKLKNNKKN
jgi:hypothetical protein